MKTPTVKTEGGATLDLEVQYALDGSGAPSQQDLRRWTLAALQPLRQPVELVIRIVDETESRELNSRYRGIDRPTNVLSFPFEAPPAVASSHLGDLVICAPVVNREALEQHKPEQHHWAHMVVHGILHLRGYDHQSDEDASEMEALEKCVLQQLGVPAPYRETEVTVTRT
ncbi:MAG: rRNA maturation RNase YbeY [Thiogranum sp.]|nr:rRNA maturation RNase YbeY [Thiogranum sp.]